MQIAKIVSSFSLLIIVALAAGQNIRALNRHISKIEDPAELIEYVASHYPSNDLNDDLVSTILFAEEALNDDDQEYVEEVAQELRDMIAARAQYSKVSGEFADAQKRAEDIKKAPYYNDPGVNKGSNWLRGAAEKFAKLFEQKPRDININQPNIPTPRIDFIFGFMRILLVAAIVVFAVLVIKNIAWKRGLKRKATALLDDDEPERTLDEWLDLATKLSQAKNYREAVRCLYLACLLKFDEYNIARFDRGETNWEHLARINRSPRKPRDLDFQSPTQLFDRVWYGRHVRGIEDVDQFQTWYREITSILKESAAA